MSLNDAESVLSGVSATSLITLWARGAECQLPDSLLQDRFALEAVEKFPAGTFSRLHVPRDGVISLAIRTKVLDDWTREFLNEHPQAIVVHLGCGLDSRYFRLNPSDGVQWFNVDLPEVIQIRRQIFPLGAGDTLIEASVTSDDWLSRIPRSRPTLIVTEGLLPYLPKSEVKRLLDRLLNHFESGELIFDAYRSLGVWLLNRHPSIRATQTRLQWKVDDPHELEEWDKRLILACEKTRHDPHQIARLSLPLRWMNQIPYCRTLGRLLKYRFSNLP
ncbi:MAG TPA: class I SAM-dependent methyltransferase [Planctomicrobium sp.]|nr:class I SAM-dependent methyltransferase [Planctomicrobium sp.]